jgi:hypothetical protein
MADKVAATVAADADQVLSDARKTADQLVAETQSKADAVLAELQVRRHRPWASCGAAEGRSSRRCRDTHP